jgi:hypothetical protein
MPLAVLCSTPRVLCGPRAAIIAFCVVRLGPLHAVVPVPLGVGGRSPSWGICSEWASPPHRGTLYRSDGHATCLGTETIMVAPIRRFLLSLHGPIRRRRSLPTSPLELVTDAPPIIARELQGRVVTGLPPSPPPKQHWMYQVDQDAVLHVYGGPAGRIRRSLPDRRVFQVDLPGLPRVRATADEGSRLWVMEDRLAGAPPDVSDVTMWFPGARDWLVRLAGPPGPALRTTPFWDAHQPDSLEATPAGLEEGVRWAWDIVGDMPARSLHGDVQPRNLVIGSHGVGLIDWEGFWRHGLPGLDLVFLALMSARRVPDQRVIAALAHGEEPPGRPLRGALAEVGVAGTVLRASLLAMLAVWTLGEARRMARGGRKSFRRHRRRPFRAMLSAVGPVLASEP